MDEAKEGMQPKINNVVSMFEYIFEKWGKELEASFDIPDEDDFDNAS